MSRGRRAFVDWIDNLTGTLSEFMDLVRANNWLSDYFPEPDREIILRALVQTKHYNAGLLIGLCGGTGVGKSSIINLLAGKEISQASQRRPYTDKVIIYKHVRAIIPENLTLQNLPVQIFTHDIQSLQRILLLDLPDFDSYELKHHDIFNQVIVALDLVIWVTDPEKYADRIFYQFLQREASYKTNFIFVFNKIDRFFTGMSNDKGKKFLAQVKNDFENKLHKYEIKLPQLYLTSALWEASTNRSSLLAQELNQFGDFREFIYTKLDAKLFEHIKSTNLVHVLDSFLSSSKERKVTSLFQAEIIKGKEFLSQGRRKWLSSWYKKIHPLAWEVLLQANLEEELLLACSREWTSALGLGAELVQRVKTWGSRYFKKSRGKSQVETEISISSAILKVAESMVEVPEQLGLSSTDIHHELLGYFKRAINGAEDEVRARFRNGSIDKHWIVSQHLLPIGLAAYILALPLIQEQQPFSSGLILSALAVLPAGYFFETLIARRAVIRRIRQIWKQALITLDSEVETFWQTKIGAVLENRSQILQESLDNLAKLESVRNHICDQLLQPAAANK